MPQIEFEYTEEQALQALDAYALSDDGRTFCGTLEWASNKPARGYKRGEIITVWVAPHLRFCGIAREMFRRAQQVEPPARHSAKRTDEGTAWAEHVSGDVPRLRKRVDGRLEYGASAAVGLPRILARAQERHERYEREHQDES